MLDIKQILEKTAKQKPLYSDESDLEQIIASVLTEEGYATQCQQAFHCDALGNNENIITDMIVNTGKSKFAFELKYVFLRDGKKGDPPAFSYDVLKDCVKCEYLIKKQLIDQAYVVGLTNIEPLWAGNGPQGWSKNYGREISKTDSNIITGLIKTNGSDEYKAIFKQKRYSLFLEYKWSFFWHDFSSADISDSNGKTRALILSPNLETKPTPRTLGDYDSCAVIPFIDQAQRQEARRRYEKAKGL